ncbi:hypothetical protein ACIQMJ_34430 [Actinosynnema sp. NPDC091369]
MHASQDHARGHFPHGRPRRPREGGPDLSTAPPWVKALVWVGVLTALLGLTVIGLAVVCDSAPAPDLAAASVDGFPGRDPFPGAPIPAVDGLDGATGGRTAQSGDTGFGIGLLFAGFTLAAVAALAHSQRARHQVTGSAPRP